MMLNAVLALVTALVKVAPAVIRVIPDGDPTVAARLTDLLDRLLTRATWHLSLER